MPNKKFFRCTVCNDIHFGISGPKPCPTCSAEDAYIEIETKEAEELLKIELNY